MGEIFLLAPAISNPKYAPEVTSILDNFLSPVKASLI